MDDWIGLRGIEIVNHPYNEKTCEYQWFPVDFSLNQSIEWCDENENI